jgi:predicted DNA-binding protein YlxM (UPF0122 family)
MLLNDKDKQAFREYYPDHTIQEIAEHFRTTRKDVETTAKMLGLTKYKYRKTWAHIKRDKDKKLGLI